jgi:hypothetical protein
MAKEYKSFVEVVELEENKLMLIAVVNKRQLGAIHEIFEPLSRSWRGQFQAFARAVVESYNTWKANKK